MDAFEIGKGLNLVLLAGALIFAERRMARVYATTQILYLHYTTVTF